MTATWSIQSYRRPYLRIDGLERTANYVLVSANGETFELQGAEPNELDTLFELLSCMRDPNSLVWRRLGEVNPWEQLVADLDRLGLLAEDDSELTRGVETAHRALVDMVDQAVGWITEMLPRDDQDRLAMIRSIAATWSRRSYGLLAQYATLGQPDLVDAAPRRLEGPLVATMNLVSDAVDLQLQHWSRTAPHCLAAASLVLRDVAGRQELPGSDDLASAVLQRLAAGCYEPGDVASGLTCLGEQLIRASAPDAARQTSLGLAPAIPVSGTNLMLEAEATALRALDRLGPSRYHQALVGGEQPRRMAIGTYVEQFHTTRRFVEIIVPELSKRLIDPLRSRMFSYYAEEIGHEVFELETCVALGLDRTRVLGSTPMSAWTLYLDAFCEISTVDPIGFLVSVMVTEGLPGTSTPVNTLLAAAGAMDGTSAPDVMRQHEQLNVELDHTTLARRFLSEVAVVPAATAARALEHMLLLLELNHRAWDELLDYYGDPSLPIYRTPFPRSSVRQE